MKDLIWQELYQVHQKNFTGQGRKRFVYTSQPGTLTFNFMPPRERDAKEAGLLRLHQILTSPDNSLILSDVSFRTRSHGRYSGATECL